MLHEIMVSRLMIHVKQVEESQKRKDTRVGNKSRQAEENFSGKSSTEIRDKPKFKKRHFHQGESSSSKGLHDRNYESRVKRNNEVDTPQERPPCRKCGKLQGGECMRGTNACYSFGKPGHMVKDCLIRRSQ